MERFQKNHDSQPLTPFFSLIWLTIFARISLGNSLLNNFMSYTLPGGMFFEKIHPANYLFIAVILLLFFQKKLPDFIRTCKRDINSLVQFFLFTSFIVVLSVAFKGTAGMAYLVDTHIFAAAIGIITYGCSREHKEIIKNTLLIFILLNSIVAIGEVLFQQHLIGYAQHATMPSFRSAALLGHPLKNSLITATALFFVLTTQWRTSRKLITLFFYAASLLCYGGRVASIVCTVALFFFLLVRFFRDFKEKPKYLEISIFIFGIPLLLLTGFVLVEYFGFGTRMFERELFDQSGMARINLFYIFSYIPFDTLLVGMPSPDILRLSKSALELPTIENFWVMLILVQGLPAALIIGGSLLNTLFRLSIQQVTAGRLGTIAFLLIASADNSLSTKSVTLTILILFLVTSFTPDEPQETLTASAG